MEKVNKWEANPTQKAFLEILKKEDEGITLADIASKYGAIFKTGTINVLAKKGLVETQKIAISCLIVREDNPSQIVGHCVKEVSLWKLARQ